MSQIPVLKSAARQKADKTSVYMENINNSTCCSALSEKKKERQKQPA